MPQDGTEDQKYYQKTIGLTEQCTDVLRTVTAMTGRTPRCFWEI